MLGAMFPWANRAQQQPPVEPNGSAQPGTPPPRPSGPGISGFSPQQQMGILQEARQRGLGYGSTPQQWSSGQGMVPQLQGPGSMGGLFGTGAGALLQALGRQRGQMGYGMMGVPGLMQQGQMGQPRQQPFYGNPAMGAALMGRMLPGNMYR